MAAAGLGITVSQERELRDALEKAQARAKKLEQLIAEESEDREALAVELREVREALDDARQKLVPLPGESRELVRLHAQVNAQQLQLSNLQLERDRLLKQLAMLTQKPNEKQRADQLAELIRLREELAAREEP